MFVLGRSVLISVDEGFVEEMASLRVASSGSFWGACSESPAVFAEKCLGFRFFAWQLYVLSRINDPSTLKRVFPVLTARQVGKTELAAIYAFWATFFNKLPGGAHGNTEVGVVSNTDEGAMRLVERIKNWVDVADVFLRDNYKDGEGVSLFGDSFFSERLAVKSGNGARAVTWRPYDKALDGEFVLRGSRVGSVIRSLPPTRKILGGTYGLFIIDEAGDSKNIGDEVFFDYVDPTANRNDAKIFMFSTPWNPSGFFYEFVDPEGVFGERERVESFGFTIDAVRVEDPEYYERMMKKIRSMEEAGRVDEVQRAYYCRFVKGEQAYFDPDRVRDVFVPGLRPVTESSQPVVVGIDFGAQGSSQTVLTASCFDEKTGVITRLADKVYGVGEDDSVVEDVESWMRVFNVDKIVYDDAATGRFLYEEFHRRGWNAFPMNFRRDKVAKYGAFRGKLNKGLVKSYPDEDLKVEMLALENSPKRSRTLIGAPPGYSDDRIDSFLCSCFFFLGEDEDKSGFVDPDGYSDGLERHKKSVGDKRVGVRGRRRSRGFERFFGDDLW